MRVLKLEHKGVTPLESLDKHDRQILYIKAKNARIPISKIAEHVPLSPDGIKYRLKRLEELGILVGSRTAVNIRALGLSSYHIFVQLSSRSMEKQSAYIKKLSEHPFVNAIITYSGKWDMEIAVMATDVYHFDSIMHEIIDPEIVADYEILALVGGIKSNALPQGFLPDAQVDIDYRKNDSSFYKDFRNRASKAAQPKLDKLDTDILKVLADDASHTLFDLGERFGVSKDTIANRIKNMVNSNIIVDFRPVINYSALGLSIQILLVKMATPTGDVKKRLDTWLRANSNVVWAVNTLGRWDLLVYMITSSSDQLHKTIEDFRQKFGDCVKNYDTLFAYEEHKYTFLPAGIVGGAAAKV
jgi:DNA-binding Lrp family transcriptional regulator